MMSERDDIQRAPGTMNGAIAGANQGRYTALAPWVQMAAALAVAFALVFYLTPFGAAISPDSIYYLDIATHIHNGAGAKSVDYALAHAGENRAVANTVWPPLYPALLALGFAPPSVTSAALWSALLLAATLFCVQRVLSRILPWRFAMLAALPLAIIVPMSTIHVYAWSEQLFTAILAALSWAALAYLAGEGDAVRRRRLLLPIALLLVLAFYTRYIGLLFFVLLPLLYLLDGSPRELRRTYLGCALFCCAAVAALLFYNVQVGGHLTGSARAPAQSGVFEQCRHLASALAACLLAPGLTRVLALCALLAVPFAYQQLQARAVLPERRLVTLTAALAFGGALYYLLGVLLLRTFVVFDAIDMRLIAVVAPWAWIGCVALLAGFERRPTRAAPALISAALIAALLVSGLFTVRATRQNWQAYGTPGLRMAIGKPYGNYNVPEAANQNRNFFAPRTRPDSILVGDEPHVMRYTTGLASYELPREYSAGEMAKLASAPADSYLVLYSWQREAVEAALVQHGAQSPRATVAGDTVLLHLPLVMRAPAD